MKPEGRSMKDILIAAKALYEDLADGDNDYAEEREVILGLFDEIKHLRSLNPFMADVSTAMRIHDNIFIYGNSETISLVQKQLIAIEKMITLDRIAEYCRAYDEIYEQYPESRYEGEAVLEFILECEER